MARHVTRTITTVGRVDTFLHLSLPVLDLDRAVAFYVDVLGCTAGRSRPEQGFADVWFHGLQLTLQAVEPHVGLSLIHI